MKKHDKLEIEDKNGRRRFIRTGAAFLLAGSAAASAQEELLVADCDSLGTDEEKNPELEGSDSDSGATADRPGCGRKKPPTMTRYNKNRDKKITLGKVIV